MDTTVTKILFTSMLSSTAVPSVLMSAERESSAEQILMIRSDLRLLLGEAVQAGDSETVNRLTHKIKIDGAIKDGYSQLDLRLFMPYQGLFEMLIKKGRGLVNSVDFRGWTPLHYAATCDNPKIVKILLVGGAHINDKGNLIDKKTPYQIFLEQPKSQANSQKNWAEMNELFKNERGRGYH